MTKTETLPAMNRDAVILALGECADAREGEARAFSCPDVKAGLRQQAHAYREAVRMLLEA